jgi:hypothetical protein
MIDRIGAMGAGLVGGAALMLMTDGSRMIGLTEANLSRYQGCILLGRSEGAAPLLAGAGMHLAMGSVLGLGYAFAFPLVWGEATWRTGALLGAVHGVAAGAGFPVLDAMNPCVRDGRMRGFGLMGRGYGALMTLGLLGGHVVYGALVGWLYTVPGT